MWEQATPGSMFRFSSEIWSAAPHTFTFTVLPVKIVHLSARIIFVFVFFKHRDNGERVRARNPNPGFRKSIGPKGATVCVFGPVPLKSRLRLDTESRVNDLECRISAFAISAGHVPRTVRLRRYFLAAYSANTEDSYVRILDNVQPAAGRLQPG